MTLQKKFAQLEKETSALLATNFYNYETLTGILFAAETLKMPVILQASPSTIRYLGTSMTIALARSALETHKVEGWLHLDHAHSLDLIKECLQAGFDSIMIDASEKSFEENVKITSDAVSIAESFGASVEAELGYVAKLGQSQKKAGFTDPEEAKEFADRTGIDALAIAIGSAHGFYKEEPNLDLVRLKNIYKVTPCALVLHGGSGIPDNQLQEGIRCGIRKINVATEIKDIFMKTLRNVLNDTDDIDLRKVFPLAIEQVNKLVQKKLSIIKQAC